MHKIDILPEILERARAMRGGRTDPHPLDLRRTAHLVIDMQIGFMEPGALSEVPEAREIVANINRISAAMRAHGGMNVFMRFNYDPAETNRWPSWYDRLCGPGMGDERRASFLRGSRNTELWPELVVREGDWVVDKTRFSAFTHGTCDLHEKLQAHGIDTVIVTGTLTNCCSESSARDAHQLGYAVLFVSDGNAALTDAEHNATLNNLYVTFADLVMTEDLVRLIGAAHQSDATTA